MTKMRHHIPVMITNKSTSQDVKKNSYIVDQNLN